MKTRNARANRKRNRNSGFATINNSVVSTFHSQNQMIRNANAAKRIGRPNNKGI